MILWNRSTMALSAERDVIAAEAGLIEEGHALITAKEGGIGKVKRSTAGTGEFFTGVAMGARRAFTVGTKVEDIVGDTSAVLLKKAATGSIGAFRKDTGAAITVSASAASTTNIQSGTDSATGQTTLTFHTDHDGVEFTVVYNYTMTSSEESIQVGDTPGQFAVGILGKVGVFYAGIVYTDKISPTANWYAALNTVKIVANGLFTDSGSGTGTVLTNAEILAVPTSDVPYLGLRLR